MLVLLPCTELRADDRTAIFEELDVGVDFVHDNGMTGKFYLPEIVGGGGALIDADGDGDLDLYLVQSGSLEGGETSSGDRFYRNDLGEGGDLAFVDATGESGPGAGGYGMGAASGDFDNDGRPDLYVTALGSNRLLHNRGTGSDGALELADVTEAAGADDPRWSVSAAFFDYDRDGWLDLFVVNYVDFSVATKRECFAPSSAPDYCGPDAYDPVPDRLLRNRGDGTFEDVTLQSGLAVAYGAGLGVVSADFDGDAWLDVYVANDGDPNQLWLNLQGRGFRDEALLAGVSLNREGMAEAGMGVDAADFDGDGDLDIFLTHLSEETNTLYVNRGSLLFEDRTIEARLHAPSLRYTGFGTAFFDWDNDGFLDVVALNGAVRIIEELVQQGDPYPLGQTNQLFHNDGGSRFIEVSERAGAPFQLVEVSRAALIGDLDNDGDQDLVQVNNRGPARVLSNRVGQSNHWIGIRAVGRHGREALGSSVEVHRSDGRVLTRQVRTDGGYAAGRSPRLVVGLADQAGAVDVVVHWYGGKTETWRGLEVDRYHTLSEGKGAS